MLVVALFHIVFMNYTKGIFNNCQSRNFTRFIANSSSCTTTELSKLLTSCLTAIKSHVIIYCETVYETSNKNWFWSIKILVRCSVN